MTPGRRRSDCIVRTPDLAAWVGCHTKITELCLLNLAGNGVQQNLLCSVLGYGHGLCLKTRAAWDRTKTITVKALALTKELEQKCEGRFTNRPYTSLAPQNRQTAIPKISPASHKSELCIFDLTFAAVMTQLTCRFNDVVQASDMRF